MDTVDWMSKLSIGFYFQYFWMKIIALDNESDVNASWKAIIIRYEMNFGRLDVICVIYSTHNSCRRDKIWPLRLNDYADFLLFSIYLSLRSLSMIVVIWGSEECLVLSILTTFQPHFILLANHGFVEEKHSFNDGENGHAKEYAEDATDRYNQIHGGYGHLADVANIWSVRYLDAHWKQTIIVAPVIWRSIVSASIERSLLATRMSKTCCSLSYK